MLLTDEQRRDFTAWLESQIITDRQLLEQMAKLSFPGIENARKQELAAKIIVHRILLSTESQTIG